MARVFLACVFIAVIVVSAKSHAIKDTAREDCIGKCEQNHPKVEARKPEPVHSVLTHAVSKRHGIPETGADCDPHLILNVKNFVDEYVCYDVYGTPGDIFQFLIDPVNKIYVNGEMREHNNPDTKRTVISRVGIKHQTTEIIVTVDDITLAGKTYQWKVGQEYTSGDVTLKVESLSELGVGIGAADNIWFLVKRHLQPGNPYLGFYFSDTSGLSQECGGLLGEFLALDVKVDRPYEEHVSGQLTRFDIELEDDLTVYANKRRNFATNQNVKCWVVRNSGLGLLLMPLDAYLMQSLV